MSSQKQYHTTGRLKRPSQFWGWMLVLGAVAAFTAIATFDLWWPGGGTHSLAVSAEEVARGEALFAQYCQQCHGSGAQGENPLNPMGGGKPGGGYLAPALNAQGHAHHHPPHVLLGYLRDGSPAADSPMRGFKDRLTEKDMRAVLGYVWSLWPESIQRGYAQTHGLH
jgi:mono/diheme cytochrome c family protein